jgi:hypothetical protein
VRLRLGRAPGCDPVAAEAARARRRAREARTEGVLSTLQCAAVLALAAATVQIGRRQLLRS